MGPSYISACGGEGASSIIDIPMASDVILETEGLTKEFRGFVAVKDVSLRVRRGTHPRADRPQRRRQDHLLQPADQVPDADARAHPLQRARHHRLAARRHRAAGAGALLPDLGGVPAPDRARERAHRAAARGAAAPSISGARSSVLDGLNDRALELLDGGRARRLRAARRRSSCPTAASARWRSPPRWRSTRRCCCSTSRRPAWATRTWTASSALIKRVAANRTVLMVEHNLSVVAEPVATRITVLARGEVLAEGDYADRVAEPGGDRGLHGIGDA